MVARAQRSMFALAVCVIGFKDRLPFVIRWAVSFRTAVMLVCVCSAVEFQDERCDLRSFKCNCWVENAIMSAREKKHVESFGLVAVVSIENIIVCVCVCVEYLYFSIYSHPCPRRLFYPDVERTTYAQRTKY